MTQIQTTRFGTLAVSARDLLHFPQGLIGFEHCRRWVLLADTGNPALGWLQSASHAEIALAVISPRRFFPEYRFQLRREQLATVELEDWDRTFVLNVVAQNAGRLTVNLQAPLVVNLDRRLGCQVVAVGEHALQQPLAPLPAPLKKSA